MNQPQPTTKINLYDIMLKALQGNEFRPLNSFIQMHDVEKHEDGAGNGDDFYKADNIKYIERFHERHGFDDGTDKEIYDRFNPDIDEFQKASRQNAFSAIQALWQRDPSHAHDDSGNDSEYQ